VNFIKMGNAVSYLHTNDFGLYKQKVRKIICNLFRSITHNFLEKVITNERTVSTGRRSQGIYKHPHLRSNLPSGQTGKNGVEKLSLSVAS
jgi:hypothetical protein